MGKGFSGGPMIADTYGVGRDVRMENRGQHPALRRLTGIGTRQENFYEVSIFRLNGAARQHDETGHQIFDLILFGGVPECLLDADSSVGWEGLDDLILVRLEALQPDAHCFFLHLPPGNFPAV